MKKSSPLSIFVCALLVCLTGEAAEVAPTAGEVRVLKDVPYKTGSDFTEYESERCTLDIYLPAGRTNFATLIWFHGGALKMGDKRDDATLGTNFVREGVAFVSANYRLSPRVKFPAYVQDAAAAVAWTHSQIAQHGGDTNKVFVGGHSAGGWLAFMVGLDEHYLRDLGMQVSDIAGFIPVSGQTMTHYTVREEREIGQFTVTADEAAPVFFARANTPPFLVLYADHDMAARAEENAYFVSLMKGAGNKRVTGLLVKDRDHGSIAAKLVNDGDPARVAIVNFIRANQAAESK